MLKSKIKKMPPALGHILLGLLITFLVGFFSIIINVGSWGVGVIATFIFYFSRERRQSEEWYGDNLTTRWRPRAWRDMLWPTIASILFIILIELL